MRQQPLSENLCGAVEQAAALDPVEVLQTVIDTVGAQAECTLEGGPGLTDGARRDASAALQAVRLMEQAQALLRRAYSGPCEDVQCHGECRTHDDPSREE